MGIKIKNKDPKTTDFASTDLVINRKGGTLFFKSDSDLVKLQPLGGINEDTIEEVYKHNIGISPDGITGYKIESNFIINPSHRVDVPTGGGGGGWDGTTDVTLSSGKTLNVSSGTLTTSAAQKQTIVGGADGAAIDNCVIGATTAVAGTFTDVTATNSITVAKGSPILTLKDTTDDDDHQILFKDESDNTVYKITTSSDIFTLGSVESKPIEIITNDTLRLTIEATGAVSASGDVYSNNHEALHVFSGQVDKYGGSPTDPAGGQAAAGDWWGPGAKGINEYLWRWNYGDDTQVQTLERVMIPSTGIQVPYKCQLVGFRAMAAHSIYWDASLGTLSVALYTADGDAASFNDLVGTAADLTLTQRCIGTSGTVDTKGNPVSFSVTDGVTELDAGDIVYPRVKSSTATNHSSNDFYFTITVLIKRAK